MHYEYFYNALYIKALRKVLMRRKKPHLCFNMQGS